MSWSDTKSAWGRLVTGLAEADEDTRWEFKFWLLGLASMAMAIIAEFGWRGALFVFGFLLWRTSFQKERER